MRYTALSCSFLAILVGLPIPAARAETPFTSERAEVDLVVNYGWRRSRSISKPDPELEGADPYRFGVGVRGGYTFPTGLHLGGSVGFFPWGERRRSLWIVSRPEGEPEQRLGWTDTSLLQLMFETGYDIGLSRTIVVRPLLGAGMIFVRTRHDVPDISPEFQRYAFRRWTLAVAPGVMVLMDLGPVHGFLHGRYNVGVAPDELFVDALVVGAGLGKAF